MCSRHGTPSGRVTEARRDPRQTTDTVETSHQNEKHTGSGCRNGRSGSSQPRPTPTHADGCALDTRHSVAGPQRRGETRGRPQTGNTPTRRKAHRIRAAGTSVPAALIYNAIAGMWLHVSATQNTRWQGHRGAGRSVSGHRRRVGRKTSTLAPQPHNSAFPHTSSLAALQAHRKRSHVCPAGSSNPPRREAATVSCVEGGSGAENFSSFPTPKHSEIDDFFARPKCGIPECR
jgi:hypothetical protein